jgi:hypothetical protein
MAASLHSGLPSITRKMETLSAPVRVSFESAYETPGTTPQDAVDASFEWGWFENFDDGQEGLLDCGFTTSGDINQLSTRRLAATPSPSVTTETPTTSTPHSFETSRRLPPLAGAQHTPYHRSKFPWMRVLPSYSQIEASLQIESFRVVDSEAPYAEYLIEMRLDGRDFCRWRRFSELARFASALDPEQFQRSMQVWQDVEASSRWFYRLELDYLHKRCQMLEQFAQAVLAECSDAHVLAELLGGP